MRDYFIFLNTIHQAILIIVNVVLDFNVEFPLFGYNDGNGKYIGFDS